MVQVFTHWWRVIGVALVLVSRPPVTAAVDMDRASQLHAHSARDHRPGLASRDAHSPPHQQQTHETPLSSVKSETLPLEQILRELPAADVARLLAAAGYTNVDLGKPVHDPPSTGKRFVERTTARQCETVVMHGRSSMTEREANARVRLDEDLDAMDDIAAGAAQAQGSAGSTAGGSPKRAASTGDNAPAPTQRQASFVEEEEAVVESRSEHQSQSRGDSSGDGKTTLKQLNCECETYKCSCRKDCYCRFVVDASRHMPHGLTPMSRPRATMFTYFACYVLLTSSCCRSLRACLEWE